MREKLKSLVGKAQSLKEQGKSIDEIGEVLNVEEASLALTVVTLKKIGYNFEAIDEFLDQSPIWSSEKVNLTALFFEYVELDDDLMSQ